MKPVACCDHTVCLARWTRGLYGAVSRALLRTLDANVPLLPMLVVLAGVMGLSCVMVVEVDAKWRTAERQRDDALAAAERWKDRHEWLASTLLVQDPRTGGWVDSRGFLFDGNGMLIGVGEAPQQWTVEPPDATLAPNTTVLPCVDPCCTDR